MFHFFISYFRIFGTSTFWFSFLLWPMLYIFSLKFFQFLRFLTIFFQKFNYLFRFRNNFHLILKTFWNIWSYEYLYDISSIYKHFSLIFVKIATILKNFYNFLAFWPNISSFHRCLIQFNKVCKELDQFFFEKFSSIFKNFWGILRNFIKLFYWCLKGTITIFYFSCHFKIVQRILHNFITISSSFLSFWTTLKSK